MIQFKNVSKIYVDKDKATLGLRDVNLELNDTGVVAICGESGSGKSTFLKLLAKLDSPTEGEIIIDFKNTSEYDLDEMNDYRFQNISFIYQDYNLIESMSVIDNVMMPLLIKNYSIKDAKTKALDAIARVGIESLKDKRCNKLSGGEKQRCAIARAIALDTKIIASDEPTANLDSETAKGIVSLLASLGEDHLVVIVTHNFDEIKDFATRRILFKNNEIALDEELSQKKGILQVYKKSDVISFKKMIQMSFYNSFRSFNKAFIMILTGLIFSLLLFITFTAENISLNQYKYTNRFINAKENSVYVLANDSKPIDSTIFQKYNSYNRNPSEELRSCIYEIKNYKNANLYYHDEMPSLLLGRYPNASNEVCINLEGNLTEHECEVYLNKEITGFRMGDSYIIVGVASSATKSYLFGNDYLQAISKMVSSSSRVCINYDGTITNILNSSESTTKIYDYSRLVCRDATKNKITFPKSFEGQIQRFDIYYEIDGREYLSSGSEFLIEYDGEETILEINKDYIFDKCFDAIIYDVNPEDEIAHLKNMGYYAVDMVYYSLEDDFMNNASVYTSIALIYSIVLSSFLIFGFIFLSLFKLRNKEYLVLSSLGLNKKKTRQLLSLEFIGYFLVSFILSLFLAILFLNIFYKNLSILNICLKSTIFVFIFSILCIFILNQFVLSKKKALGKGGKRND